MNGWENFFIGELGASATLTGLIFLGVSVSIKTIISFAQLPNRALQALVTLGVVLFISSLLLIPGQTFLAIGMEVLLIGLIAWITMSLIQLDSLHKIQSQYPQYRRGFVYGTMPCQIAALSFVVAGVVLLTFDSNGLYWVVAATLLSFLAAFIDAWILLIEINR